jgi:hypothetical protein
MGLGRKLSAGVKGLGSKISKGTETLGKKISNVERQAQRGISKGVEMGQGAIRDVERGIVSASGKVGAIKQGLNTGARVIDALQTTGLTSMVPALGLGLGAISSGLKAGSRGLQQVQDVGRDTRLATGKAKNQLSTVGEKASGRVANVAGRGQMKLEKFGERSKALEAQAQQDIGNVRSAFQG